MNADADNEEESAEWKTSWSTQKMREKSLFWSLAGDAGLLLRLQKASETLIMAANDTHTNIKNLVHDAKAVNSRINNSVNSFLMLANAQFVENRVYDEEVTEEATNAAKPEEQEKTKEQRESELVPRISLALNLALQVVDQAFVKHEIVDSESEDEGGQSCLALPVLEPKDPYSHRPLPYIIGSEKFLQDDRIGLIDVFSEEEGEESEKESLSESYRSTTAEKKPISFVEASDTESDASTEWKEEKAAIVSQEDINEDKNGESEDENMFGVDRVTDSPDEDDNLLARQVLADELTKKLAVPQKSGKPEETTEPKQQVKARTRTLSDEFSNAVDDGHEEDDDLFSKHNSLFSSKTSGGLFDERNDQDDLFSELIKNEILEQPKRTEKPVKSISPAKKMSIFDNDDDFDDFSSKKGERTKSKASDTDAEPMENTPKKSLPAGAVSLFGNAVNPLTAAIKARCTVDTDSENQDDWSGSDKGKPPSGDVKSSSNAPSTNGGWMDGTNGSITSSLSSASLFAEEPDAGDIFAFDATRKPSLPVGGVSLFDDDLEADDDLFGSATILRKESTKSSQSRSNSLSTRNKMDDVTPEVSGRRGSSSSKIQSHGSQNENDAVGSKAKTSPPKKVSLFDDDDDDIFSEPKSKPAAKPLDGSSRDIFADDKLLPDKEDASFDIFKTAVETPKSTTGKPPVPTPRRPVESKPKSEDQIAANRVEPSPRSEKPKSPAMTKTRPSSVPFFEGTDQLPEQILETVKEPAKTPSADEVETAKLAAGIDEVNRLVCVTKGRAKIQAKRRPPTRRAQRDASTHSSLPSEEAKAAAVNDVDSSPPRSSKKDDESDSATTTTPVDKAANETLAASVTSPSTEEDDIFSLSDSLLVPVMKSHRNDKFDDLEQEFGRSLRKPLQVTNDASDEDQLFSGVAIQAALETKKVTKPAVTSQEPSVVRKGSKSSKDLFDDDSDSDDLFASVSSWKEKHQSTSSKLSRDSGTKQKSRSLFGNSDDDDDADIFGTPRSNAQ